MIPPPFNIHKGYKSYQTNPVSGITYGEAMSGISGGNPGPCRHFGVLYHGDGFKVGEEG